jgi:hypothetical protein
MRNVEYYVGQAFSKFQFRILLPLSSGKKARLILFKRAFLNFSGLPAIPVDRVLC